MEIIHYGRGKHLALTGHKGRDAVLLLALAARIAARYGLHDTAPTKSSLRLED
jgi:hypothetical protein